MSSSGSASSDDDFMSDKFLAAESSTVKQDKEACPSEPLGYSERRRRHLDDAREKERVKSRAEREADARKEGLSRSLLDDRVARQEDDDKPRARRRSASPDTRPTKRTPSPAPRSDDDAKDASDAASDPALRMLLAMGFKPGQGLGKQQRADATRAEKDAISSTGQADTSAQARPRTDPMAIDERWLGKKRFGIGAALSREIGKAVDAAQLADTTTSDVEDFRLRARQVQDARHTEALLAQARYTCEGMDRALDIDFSPLWLNPEALTKPSITLPPHVAELIEYAFAGLDRLNAKERDVAAKSLPSDQTVPSKPILAQDDDDDNDEAAMARAAESRRFCKLSPKARLEISLSHLRRAHLYCLHCGIKYASEREMAGHCPGEEEEDH